MFVLWFRQKDRHLTVRSLLILLIINYQYLRIKLDFDDRKYFTERQVDSGSVNFEDFGKRIFILYFVNKTKEVQSSLFTGSNLENISKSEFWRLFKEGNISLGKVDGCSIAHLTSNDWPMPRSHCVDNCVELRDATKTRQSWPDCSHTDGEYTETNSCPLVKSRSQNFPSVSKRDA